MGDSSSFSRFKSFFKKKSKGKDAVEVQNDHFDAPKLDPAHSLASIPPTNGVNHDPVDESRLRLPLLSDPATSIRLCRLDSIDEAAEIPLSTTLSSFRLDEAPEYFALSYTWGSPVPDDFNKPFDSDAPFTLASALRSRDLNWKDRLWPVTINKQQVRVTRNLRDALYRLTPGMLGSWLWVDAICIDQEDLAERSAQVSLMAEIYTKAKKVKVWLGEEDETIEQAHALQQVLYKPAAERMNTVIREETTPLDPKFWRTLSVGPFPSQSWWSWIQLYRRSWFHRVWTMQEFALATEVEFLSGSYSFDYWECLEIQTYVRDSGLRSYVASLLKSHLPLDVSVPMPIHELEELSNLCKNRQHHGRPETLAWTFICGSNKDSVLLLRLLLSMQRKGTTDPRDRVFGSLGMLREIRELLRQMSAKAGSTADQAGSSAQSSPGSTLPRMDYTMHEKDVAVSTAQWMIESMPCLAYLSLIAYRPLEDILSAHGCPSWVAVLHPSQHSRMALGYATSGLQPLFDASRGMELVLGRPEIPNASLNYDRGNLGESDYQAMTAIGMPHHPGLGAARSTLDRTVFHRHFERDSRILRLKGYHIGSIERVICSPEGTLSHEAFVMPVLTYLAETDPAHMHFNHARPEQLWRTMITNTGSETEYPASDDMGLAFSHYLLFSIFGEMMSGRGDASQRLPQIAQLFGSIYSRFPAEALKHFPSPEDLDDILARFDRAVDRLIARPDGTSTLASELGDILHLAMKFKRSSRFDSHQLVELSTGNLALVPKAAKKADVIWLLAGGRVPFATRLHTKLPAHSKELQGCYQLIGETYAHGTMNGELVDAAIALRGQVPWVDVRFL